MSTSACHPIDENVKCSCKGNNLDKLLQPSILTILTERPLHGYLIIQELEKKSACPQDKPDNTGVYRMLKTMEDRGLILSQWQTDDTGTPKKTFFITGQGLKCLQYWIDTLTEYQLTIDQIICQAKSALEHSREKSGI